MGLGPYRQIRRQCAVAGQRGAPVAVGFQSLRHLLYLRPGTDELNAMLNNTVRTNTGITSFALRQG